MTFELNRGKGALSGNKKLLMLSLIILLQVLKLQLNKFKIILFQLFNLFNQQHKKQQLKQKKLVMLHKRLQLLVGERLRVLLVR